MEGRFSLLRIILIDCHIRDRISELKVDSHTNISGTNAAGKTTLQRLLPLFWGERPSNIQRRSKVKDPIPLYYLPRDSSLLVYEYLRGTGQVCQVLICSDPSREKLQYRFVDKPYSEEDYGLRKENGKFKPGSVRDIGGNLRRQNIECSELLSSVKDYQAVIQNNRQYLRKNNKLRSNLSGLAYRFAMCETNESLVHMEKIVTAILSKHGKLDAMRQMVAQIIQENSQAFEAPKIDSAALKTMTNDIAMLQSFKTNQQRFESLISLGAEFNDLILTIRTHKGQILAVRTLLEDTVKSVQRELEGFVQRKAVLRQQWEEGRGKHIQDKQNNESLKSTTEVRVNRIHDKRHWWADQEIDVLKTGVESLSIKYAVKQQAEERRTNLLDEASADELKLESQKYQILEKFDKQQKHKQTLLKGHEDKLRDEEIAYNEKIRHLANKHNAIVNETKDRHRDELSTYTNRISSIFIEIRTTSKTPEEESQLLTVESDHAESTEALAKLNGELLTQTTQRSDLIPERSEVNNSFTKLSRDIAGLEDEIHELSVAAYPQANSLHGFLEETAPGWKDNIGRVIEPALLQRTDLAPTLTNIELGNTIFGLNLRIGSIAPPEFLADKEALIIILNEKEATLRTMKIKKDKVEEALKKINLTLEQTGRDIAHLKSRISTAETDVQSCKDSWDMAKVEIQEAISQRKQDLIQQRKSQEKQSDVLAGKHLKALEEIAEQRRSQDTYELEYWQGIRETIESSINATNSSLTLLIQQKGNRIKDLENDFNAALKEKGIDERVIAELNQSIKQLSKEITDIENRKVLIRDFEEWQRDIWEIELPNNNSLVAELEVAITALNKDIEHLDGNFKSENDAIKTQQVESERKQRDYSEQRERLNRIQKEWGAFDRIPTTDTTFSLNSIKQNLNEVQSKLSRFDTLYRKISENIDNVSSIISINGNTAITGAWSQLRDEAQQSVSGLPDSQIYRRYAYIIERLPQLVYDQIANIEDLQKAQAQRYGDQFKKLHDTLIGYHQMIDHESRNLKTAISKNLDLEGISNAEIGLKSRIKELGYWGSLEKLVASFTEWKESGFADLPNDEFLSALSEMKELLHKITGSIQLDTIFDLFIKIEENGKPMIITSDALLDDLSSNGMKYLILCKLYMGFTKMLNESRQSVIHWPVDELGELHGENISKLFEMLNKNNVVMVGALPQPDAHLLGMFTHKYIVDKNTKQLKSVADSESDLIAKLKQLKRKAATTKEENNAAT